MDAVPGLLLKGGAEGVRAFALPGSGLGSGPDPAAGAARAGAIKIDDGAARAAIPVTVAVLRALGAVVPGELATVQVTGGGRVVGEVRAVG
jgi:L-asparaginase II